MCIYVHISVDFSLVGQMCTMDEGNKKTFIRKYYGGPSRIQHIHHQKVQKLMQMVVACQLTLLVRLIKTCNWCITITRPCNIQQYFTAVKNVNFQVKFFNIFLIFAQNIDCGYTLEPPH